MNDKETIRAAAGESYPVNERFANSMAESAKNLLHGIRDSVRRLIRNVAFVTPVSAAALGVIGCGDYNAVALDTMGCNDSTLDGCFREKLFLNFDGRTIPCGILRDPNPYPDFAYDVGYYCDGKSDDENADIAPYVSSQEEKQAITAAVRARLEPVGVEVFSDASLSECANILTVGGVGHAFGMAELDVGNDRHNNSGEVVQQENGDVQLPQEIVMTIVHEALHMLGLEHQLGINPASIMAPMKPPNSQQSCRRGLSTDEAETLAENLSGACSNQGVSFDELRKAAELGDEEAIQACLDINPSLPL